MQVVQYRAIAHAAATAVLAAALFSHYSIFPSHGSHETADGAGVGGEVASQSQRAYLAVAD